jgi:hypothetical protein
MKDIIMQSKIILLIGIFYSIPMLSIAQEIGIQIQGYESMDIKTLIEEAKEASPKERTKIENLIKKRIAKAHRENDAKG